MSTNMRPSPISVTANAIPTGQFQPFLWRQDGQYLLRLTAISIKVTPKAAQAQAHYKAAFEIIKHKGFMEIFLYGKHTWLIYLSKRGSYVQRID